MVLARMLPARPPWPSALFAMLLLAMLSHARPAHSADSGVAKAEMLWNIAKFIQWPESADQANKGQLVFTILGEDELAAELAGLLSTKTINGKPVFVRFARRAQDARGSQILYVAASEREHMGEVLAAVSGTPVLTVGDTPAFATHGGMVGFAIEGGRVRFEINLGHAERTGLKISAKLLALARVVDQAP
ncbi:MAG: YfiR family protein [Candidatus Eisenbacteria bacterium]